jgi:hypothetical protein
MTDGNETWVAVGPAGAVGSIHRSDGGFRIEAFGRHARSGVFPSLESAKRAVHASMGPLADRPDFHAH